MLIFSDKQICPWQFILRFMKLDGFPSFILRYCNHPLNLNHTNFNEYWPLSEKLEKWAYREMAKCNDTKIWHCYSITSTFWIIFFRENIGYPFEKCQVIGTWETRYLKILPRVNWNSTWSLAHKERGIIIPNKIKSANTKANVSYGVTISLKPHYITPHFK